MKAPFRYACRCGFSTTTVLDGEQPVWRQARKDKRGKPLPSVLVADPRHMWWSTEGGDVLFGGHERVTGRCALCRRLVLMYRIRPPPLPQEAR